ncbi:MAG: hypothetical protein HFG29_04895 [Eubacterium sp.]|nr:hypothetical protein [Eubacterium sp.]
MEGYVKGIKQKIKKIIGLRNIIVIKRSLCYLKGFFLILEKEKIKLNENYIDGITELSQKGRNVFCGYYDVPIFDKKNENILVHVVRKKARPGHDTAVIGIYDIKGRKFRKIAETFAWNWQQGSRLRWSVKDDDCILFNQYENGSYFCSKINIYTGKEMNRYCDALYDISFDERYGVTCDFPRLQRLRPGYGYSNIQDESIYEYAPADKGLYLVDLVENKKILLVSLDELANLNDKESVYQHYINALLFSPDGNKIMFFHIYNIHNSLSFRWRTQLCTYDIKKSKLHILEDKANVSHYTWLNNRELLITGSTIPDCKAFYRIYNCEKKSYMEITDLVLKEDGHPSKCKGSDWIITDTYPDKRQYQNLIKYDMKMKQGKTLAALFSFPRICEEKRCDLHPKVSSTGNMIAIDSTCKGGQREVIILQLK